MFGFQVYQTEVDDRGVDFVARYKRGRFIEVQVKSIRSTNYVFMHKTKFPIHVDNYLALASLLEGQPPQLFLIPSTAWASPNNMFVDRNYDGLKSKPEWGLVLSEKRLKELDQYNFEKTVNEIAREVEGTEISVD